MNTICELRSFPNTVHPNAFYYLLSKAQRDLFICNGNLYVSPGMTTRVETLALIRVDLSSSTLVNLALAIMVRGPLGPPWQIPCRAANGYSHWVLLVTLLKKPADKTSVDILTIRQGVTASQGWLGWLMVLIRTHTTYSF